MSQSSEPFDPYYQWLGIPPDEQPPNHYRLLGIQLFEENREVIQHAADRQMAHLRSFQNGPRAVPSQKLLNEVAAAKLCLLSPDRKAAYDTELSQEYVAAATAAPPLTADPPAHSGGITFGGTPGTLTTTPTFRTSRIIARPRRHGLVPWVLGGLLVIVAALALWAWWSDQRKSERLVLVWPEAARQQASLQINGQSLDLLRDPVASSPEELEIALRPGRHEVHIERAGCTPVDETIEVGGGVPVRLPVALAPRPRTAPGERNGHPPGSAVGRVALLWPVAARAGASLEIDGRVIDLTRRGMTENPDLVEFSVKAGSHTLHAVLADGYTVDRSFVIEAGQRSELTIATAPVRLVFKWPVADRGGATVEIDGRTRDLTADAVALDNDQVVFEVQPGKHSLRISRTGFEDFRSQVEDMQAEREVAVTWVVAPNARPTDAELQKLRAEFRKKYEEFEQYAKYVADKDTDRQPEVLKVLLTKLESEAGKLTAQSPEQWAACDEMLNLALQGRQYVAAQNLLAGTVGSELFSDGERQTWEDRIWAAALKSAPIDDLVDFLTQRKVAAKLPTDQEQAAIGQRLIEAAVAGTDPMHLDTKLKELLDQTVMSAAVVTQTRIEMYVKAAGKETMDPAQALDLGERMLVMTPQVFESGREDAARQVDTLVDAVSDILRHKALKEARMVDSLRIRIWKLEEGIKLVRDLASQFTRVQAARKAIAEGQATATEHRLLAFWLLQLGLFPDALPHLRDAEDEALTRIGQPLPETAKELAQRADEVELESRKSKYSRRQEEALRGLVRFLRQAALEKNDTSLGPAERVELEKKLSAAETDRHERELDNRRFPKEKWCSLADLASADELRDQIEHAGGGNWTLLEDGSIATNGKGTSQLELPIALPDSYGVRFVCRRQSGSDVNVHLPLGQTSVVLTLGGAGNRFSGLQLVDGRDITDALNPTRIPRSDLMVANGVPVAVEIHVDVKNVAAQSAKERKQSEERDWATVKVILSARKAPVVRTASLAATAFSAPKDMDLSPRGIALSTRAEAVYANLQLIRH